MALSPAFLNMTRLPELADRAIDEGSVTLTIRKILADSTRDAMEYVAHNQLVDNGVNTVSYRPRGDELISEVGVGGGNARHQRFTFDEPIAVLADEELEVTYEYRMPS